MFKRISKRVLSVILTLCLIVSMLTVGMIGSKANFFVDFALDKMMDIGMRVEATVLDGLSEAAGNAGYENVDKAVSFITNLLLKDASEVAVEKVAEMCEQILEELSHIQKEIEDDISAVEKQLGKQNLMTVQKNLDDAWDEIDTIFYSSGNNSGYSVIDAYKTYLNHALQYHKDPNNAALSDTLNEDYRALLVAYAAFGGISLTTEESSSIESMEKKIFSVTDSNVQFKNLITNLSKQLNDSGSISERAAQYAYQAFPFSHQQFTFIKDEMIMQMMNILLIEMAYNEFLYHQGEYLEAQGGDGNADLQLEFYDLMTGSVRSGENCVNKRIEDMLSASFNYDMSSGTKKMSLDDYMRPEDAVSTKLSIQDYLSSYKFEDLLDYSTYHVETTSYPVYINNDVWFKRVMTHTSYGDQVFYIIDPDKLEPQYENDNPLDVHNFRLHNQLNGWWFDFGAKDSYSPTVDYLNLSHKMSDGNNTYQMTTDHNCSRLQGFFDTNVFSVVGKKLNGYIPEYMASSHSNMMTPWYRYNDSYGNTVTQYPKFKVLPGDKACASDVTVSSKDEEDEIESASFAGDKNDVYKDDTFTVILANEGDVFNTTISSQVNHSKSADLTVSAGSAGTVSRDQSMTIEGGTMLDITVKPNGTIPNSLTLVRDSSTVTIADADDFANLQPGDDGCYHLTYPAPYSNATFVLDAPEAIEATMGEVAHGSGSFSKTESVQSAKFKPGEKVWCWFTGEEYFKAISIPEIRDTATGDKVPVTYDFGDYYIQGLKYVYEFWFIMPDNNVTVSAEFSGNTLHKATIGSFEGGTASFKRDSVVTEKDFGEWSYGSFFVTAPKNYSFEELKATDAKGREMTVMRGAENTFSGDNIIYTITFQMSDSDVTITGKLVPGFTATIDDSGNVYENGDPVAYIELKDYKNNGEYTTNPIQMPSLANTVEGRFVYDEDHYPVHIQVVGEESGKVFVDRDYKDGDEIFICINQEPLQPGETYNSFGESVLVIPTFGSKSDPVEPEKHTSTATIGTVTNGTGSFSQSESVTSIEEKPGTEIHCWFTGEEGYTSIIVPTFRDAATNETVTVEHEFGDYSVTDNRYTYEFIFTLPNNDVILDTAFDDCVMHTATIGEFTGGSASFNVQKEVKQTLVKEYENCVFYVGAPENYSFSELKITDSSGKDISFTKGADKVISGGNVLYTLTFQMPASDVTITGKLEECIMATVDKNMFVHDSNDGSATSYIELRDYQNGDTYTTDPIYLAPYMNTVQVRIVCDENHYPAHLKIMGRETVKVFYDKDVDPDATSAICITSDGAPFGEDIIVTPTFGKKTQPTEASTEAPTTAPTEAPTEAPSTAPTEAPTEPSTEPDPSTHGIRTYEELVAFRDSVNGGDYGADTYLEKNIIAPADSTWDQGIGSEDHPYTGTFDGKGYCIIGLNLKNSENAGLFGYIGSEGTVKDLLVFNVHNIVPAKYAGGIAVVNEGTIDHCISGVNLSGKTRIKLPDGRTVRPADYNSVIEGTYSGGITAVNKGLITGTRSGAAVVGENCAGIAVKNEGSIYACANNGGIGTNSVTCKRCGGLTCVNEGSIECSYNSGKINCGYNDVMGTISGVNAALEVYNVFFSRVNSIPAIGSTSTVQLNDTNKLVDNSDMMTPAFVELLNSVTDSDQITWAQTKYGNTSFNQGYPTILGKFLEQRTIALSGKVTINGVMHSSLNATAQELDSDSDEYKAMQQEADGGIITAYSLATTDDKGSYVPAQLWTSGGIQLTVPEEELVPTGADGDSDTRMYTVLIVIGEDGEAVKVYPDSTEDGKNVFTLAAPMNFAVAKTAQAPKLLGDANLDGEVDITDVTWIQRFDAKMIQLSEEAMLLADVDKDGEVSIIDATWIQRYTVNMKAPDGIGKPI